MSPRPRIGEATPLPPLSSQGGHAIAREGPSDRRSAANTPPALGGWGGSSSQRLTAATTARYEYRAHTTGGAKFRGRAHPCQVGSTGRSRSSLAAAAALASRP